MVTTADALIAVSDYIFSSISDIEKLEYSKKGRKYRFVNNNFQRVREEDKHLIVNPDDLSQYQSVISAYYILKSIGDGLLFNEYKDFCLSIVGVARELEKNRWYEEGQSVTTANYAKYDPIEVKDAAMEFYDLVEPKHITQGLNLLIISKLNFLHTDHHIGTKLEGYYMSDFIKLYYGEESVTCPEILVALKSFVHWGNIKGILYKLEVPNINISDDLKDAFSKFPDPMEEFKVHVYDRYPSGTSKYSLIRKSIDYLADSAFAKLVPYPPIDSSEPKEMINDGDSSLAQFNSVVKPASLYDLKWLYQLCHDIEKNPIKYHLRSSVKNLSIEEPVNLTELSNTYKNHINAILSFVSMYINLFDDVEGGILMQHSKIPKFNDALIAKYQNVYKTLSKVSNKVNEYKDKEWNDEDIVLRLEHDSKQKSLFDAVMEMRDLFAEDYE